MAPRPRTQPSKPSPGAAVNPTRGEVTTMQIIQQFRKSSRSGTEESCGGNVGDCVEIGVVRM